MVSRGKKDIFVENEKENKKFFDVFFKTILIYIYIYTLVKHPENDDHHIS